MSEKQNARRHPRASISEKLLVAWKRGTERQVSRVENLALGGLFIITRNPPEVGTSLDLIFQAPEGEVRVRAIVRNAVPGKGMGVGIVSMQPEHRARLDRWLKRLAMKAEPETPPT